jgi:hypothetical protein
MKERLNAIILERLNAIIIAGAILLAVVVYCFGTRYQVAGGAGGTYQVNRITGESWWLRGRAYEKVEKLQKSDRP